MTSVNTRSPSHTDSKHDDKAPDKGKKSDKDQGGSQADLDAAINAFGTQVMMQIFQDNQERQAEEREDDPDAM